MNPTVGREGEQTGEQADGIFGCWRTVHAALVALARKRAGLDLEEGRLLLAARRAEVHRSLGYGSFSEYVERLFGYAPRLTHEKLRVAAALEALPALARELREGTMSFSHARELTRVATPETEQAWLESARGRTSRQVEKLVSGRRLGSLPDSPKEAALQRHVLRFEISGETLATFREAVAKLRREAGEHLDDDAALLLMARQVLGGPTDDGRASYQVSLDICEDCQRARQLADGERVEVSSTVVAMARCDAQSLANADAGCITRAVPPRGMGSSVQADPGVSSPAAVGSTTHVGLAAHAHSNAQRSSITHAASTRHARLNAQVSSTAPAGSTRHARSNVQVSSMAHAGSTRHARSNAEVSSTAHAGSAPGITRATQDVAPAVRRSVLRRDRHRCQIPGCSHATFVDIHHIDARAEGGEHDASNLLTLCSAHHRAVHEGTLLIRRAVDPPPNGSALGSAGSLAGPVSSIGPVSSVDPGNSSGSAGSVDPASSVGPAGSVDSTKSAGLVGSVDSTKSAGLVGSVDSTKSAGLVGSVDSTSSVGAFVVCHADGTPYGSHPCAAVADVQAQAFRALRGLGFGEREARWALSHTLRDVRPDAEREVVLRQALKLLTERAWQHAC